MNDQNPIFRTILYVILAVVAVVIYAYGWNVTEINLEEPQEERRQQQVTRALRGLLRPDLVELDEADMDAFTNIMVPCGPEAPESPAADGPQTVTVSPICGAKGDQVTVEGFDFRPGTKGFVYWVTPEGNDRPVAAVRSDIDGYFTTTFTMPSAPDSEEPYQVRGRVVWPVGNPRPSEALILTIEKMIETVFLALMATTLAIPIAGSLSFIAANNLMRQLTTQTAGLLLGVIVMPLGWIAGSFLFGGLGSLGVSLGSMVWPGVLGLGVLGGLAYVSAAGIAPRPALPVDGLLGTLTGLVRTVVISCIVWVGLGFAVGIGIWGADAVGDLGSLGEIFGNFLGTLATLAELLIPVLGGVLGAIIVFGLGSDLGEKTVGRVHGVPGRIVALVLGAIALGLVVGGATIGIAKFYELSNPVGVRNTAALVGAAVGAVLGLALGADRPFPLGMTLYYSSRTLLNTIRSVEPLIMAIVFAIWVGIGPFAGVLALTLHSVAALGKLYSEQVESIDPGPIEAIQATGANQLQTIVYGVIPQIVPPYIAFTIYRWDINVRMSTIIGFVGGGGIGFILQQWINLLRYRQAGVAMLAIAIVVATLDFASARLREAII
jgi:phosphonate ABC transporter permease subunit PhnE